MKPTSMAFIAVLGVALLFGACGGSKSAEKPASGASESSPAIAAPAAPAKTGMARIGDMSTAWSALYEGNEKAINDYEGMPIMGLVTPPLALAVAVQFDIMNPTNQNGRFEGKLMMAGYNGVYEKAGNLITFDYDDTLQKDGFGPAHKAGTRVKGSGSLDLGKEHFIWQTVNEREGKAIDRGYTEFKRLGDGSMICLALNGHAFNMRGDEEMRDEAIYLHNGAGRYDFVIAKGKTGPGFTVISFADKGDLTKEQVLELFRAAGYEIDKSGGIQDGKLILDK